MKVIHYFLIVAAVVIFALFCVINEQKEYEAKVEKTVLIEDTVLVSMNPKGDVASLATRIIYTDNDTVLQPYLLGSIQRCSNFRKEKWESFNLCDLDAFKIDQVIKPYLITGLGTIVIKGDSSNEVVLCRIR